MRFPPALCSLPFTLYSLLFTLYSMLYALCPMLHAPCSMRIVLLLFGRFLSPVKEVGMPAPWNESCPGEQLSFGSFAIPLAQNLSHRSHAIPLGFTPWNSFSACLLAKNDRIGRARLDLVNRGDAIPLGVQLFFKKISHKAPLTHNEGGALCFARGSPILQ